VVNRLLSAADLQGSEVVLEIGPGLGVLTEKLVERAGHLLAIEIDAALARRLREKLGASPNFTLVEADVLEVDPAELMKTVGLGDEYVVVANLPYSIGTAILRHVLESALPPAWLIVMLQREVADAIVAAPGGMSIAGIAVQVYARARRLFSVPPGAFYPPPKVHSSVIRLDVRSEPLVPGDEREWFFQVVRAGFSAPRKQLRNSLANGLRRDAAEIEPAIKGARLDPRRRPQELAIDDWLALSRGLER
jgi:16S rRNA (adenine1518-N6/adenine1519-N6)-dimethyltransferase